MKVRVTRHNNLFVVQSSTTTFVTNEVALRNLKIGLDAGGQVYVEGELLVDSVHRGVLHVDGVAYVGLHLVHFDPKAKRFYVAKPEGAYLFATADLGLLTRKGLQVAWTPPVLAAHQPFAKLALL